MTVGVYPKQLSDLGPSGTLFGQSAADLIGFYGVATPVAQRSSSVQTTSNVTAYTSTTASALMGAWMVEVTNTLVGLGIWKGS